MTLDDPWSGVKGGNGSNPLRLTASSTTKMAGAPFPVTLISRRTPLRESGNMADRAILFIDGNNWYHACKTCGVSDLFALDYLKISKKVVGPRDWQGTRYYIGALKHHM